MISRRKLIAALGASLLPAVAHAATSTAPPPKAAPTSAVQSGKTDALKMSDAEYQTYLRDNGLTPPAGSFH